MEYIIQREEEEEGKMCKYLPCIIQLLTGIKCYYVRYLVSSSEAHCIVVLPTFMDRVAEAREAE